MGRKVRAADGESGRPRAWPLVHGAALIGEHPAVRRVRERVDRLAGSQANVLIRGEEGTGKESVARVIHASSRHRNGPFVAHHTAISSQPLNETDVLSARGGTLFLDEIDQLPRASQGELSALLALPIDVRVMAATQKSLDALARSGGFPADLLQRLDATALDLPALRGHAEDVPSLADHFRRAMNERHGRGMTGFVGAAMDRLASFDWPGNLRQLQNVVEQLVLKIADREVTVDDLPLALRKGVLDLSQTPLDLPDCGVDLRTLLAQLEQRLIGQALRRTGGNKNRAAELLGLNRTTLVEKLRRRKVA